MIRNGIREHIIGGRFNGVDLGVYLFLHIFAKSSCGLCYTNAVAIGHQLKTPTTTIKGSLQRLRVMHYINYPAGDGHRRSYLIAINKYKPTNGVLRGYQLDAFASNDLERSLTSRRPETVLKPS
jgi:hypothetical protein